MITEVGRGGVPLRAIVAIEFFFSSVTPFMPRAVRFLDEPIPTNTAGIRLLAGMQFFMPSQRIGVSEVSRIN